jgi:hypothetical protein
VDVEGLLFKKLQIKERRFREFRKVENFYGEYGC